MKQIEAVIFDWAGTTVDYGCMAPIHAMQEAFSGHRLHVTLEEIRQPMGLLKIDHIQAVLTMERVRKHFQEVYNRRHDQDDINKIYQLFEKNIFSILNQHTTVIDGVLDAQNYLRQQQIKIGSTTGYTREMLDLVASAAETQGYHPDYMISSDQVPRGRPYPYMLHQNIAALGIKDVRCVIKVGDTIVDIEEGLHAGCWSVGVVKGSSMLGLTKPEIDVIPQHELQRKIDAVKDQMRAAGADFVIETMAELPGVIEQIRNT